MHACSLSCVLVCLGHVWTGKPEDEGQHLQTVYHNVMHFSHPIQYGMHPGLYVKVEYLVYPCSRAIVTARLIMVYESLSIKRPWQQRNHCVHQSTISHELNFIRTGLYTGMSKNLSCLKRAQGLVYVEKLVHASVLYFPASNMNSQPN